MHGKKTLYKHIMCIRSKYIFKIILWKICSIKKNKTDNYKQIDGIAPTTEK